VVFLQQYLDVLSSESSSVPTALFHDLFISLLTGILSGVKPISFLGFAHSLQHKQTREEWKKKYPELEHQIRQAGFEGGLISLLLDQVIDLEFLEAKRKSACPIIPQDDTNGSSNDPIALQDMNQDNEHVEIAGANTVGII
jgi:hypothetical protein